MENHHLRSILLNLQYRLSDHDRQRLHFYLKNDVPRPVGDDSTLNGTLRLMQSLFDQEKITENDFTLLIDAFKQIQCFDAVNLLREHQRRLRLSGCNQSTQSLASIMPLSTEEFFNDCEDDKCPTEKLILKQISYSNHQNNNNHIIRSNNTNINSININEDTESLLPLQKRRTWALSFTKKCIFLPVISFLLTLSILIVVTIQGMNRIHSLKDNLRSKQNLISETRDKNNQTIKQVTNILLEKNAAIEYLNKTLAESNQTNLQTVKRLNSLLVKKEEMIEELNQEYKQKRKEWDDLLPQKNTAIEQLNKTFIDLKQERKTLLIKAGRSFGGRGLNFDDSSSTMFTTAHYLSGIVYSSLDELDSCQFIYSSSHDNQSRIESKPHGNYGAKINSTYRYYLDDDERIEEVYVKSVDKTFLDINNSHFTTKIVIELKFITTKNRIIPPDSYFIDSDFESERFSGYTLGYATGWDALRIDQLQFFWYRTKK